MIRVLIVEDSPVVRELLTHLLGLDPEIEVVGAAVNGEDAVEAARRLRPDVITMDIHMPEMNGFDATRRIMETAPTRIVIVSGSSTTQEIATTFRALEAGALAVVKRPVGISHLDHDSMVRDLIETVKLMSEVKVVRRWPQKPRGALVQPHVPLAGFKRRAADVRLVAIGASAGGPIALERIFAALPRTFPAPIVVVQHIAPGFTSGLAEWLDKSSGLPVEVAVDAQTLQPGRVLIAPDGAHIQVERNGKVILDHDEPENGHRPSISVLLRSVAEAFGEHAVGVLLTGMGRDGAAELKRMKERGALTIAQDKETSVVHGIPGEAIRLGAATYVLGLDEIPTALNELASGKNEDGGVMKRDGGG